MTVPTFHRLLGHPTGALGEVVAVFPTATLSVQPPSKGRKPTARADRLAPAPLYHVSLLTDIHLDTGNLRGRAESQIGVTR